MDSYLDASLQGGKLTQDGINQIVTESTPAKRWADPEEIGEVVFCRKGQLSSDMNQPC